MLGVILILVFASINSGLSTTLSVRMQSILASTCPPTHATLISSTGCISCGVEAPSWRTFSCKFFFPLGRSSSRSRAFWQIVQVMRTRRTSTG